MQAAVIQQLTMDEARWRQLLAETLSANTRALQQIERRLATATPMVTSEALAKAVLLSASITVGTETDFELEVTDLWDRVTPFSHLSITEVDIAAPLLVNADDVRLRLFRTGQRRVPQDLVAEFTGTSLVTGTWSAAFSNRRIEYTDETKKSTLYISIRNTSGNSRASPFEVRIYGRRFPWLAPPGV